VRYAAESQFTTAQRCRMMPAADWMSPRPSRAAAQNSSADGLRATTPASIALPMVAGISAHATIQMMPMRMPKATVAFCWRTTHQR